MKVLLVNGSPNEKGCTFTALCEAEKALHQEGVETGWFWIGRSNITGCTGCNACVKLGRCVKGDAVNEFVTLAKEYDGFIFGSPVYFSGMNGAMMSFMDRAFYSGSRGAESVFAFKPAAVVSARRAGTTSALDQMNKYFLYSQMPVIPSRYWNMVHGNTPEEVLQDEEGLQIMRVLGRNMAWFLKVKAAGEAAGVSRPQQEERRIATNFIR